MPAVVNKEECTGCGICVDSCPEEAITLNDVAEVDPEKCSECGTCVEECPQECIELED
ncbi:MAG: 4Fe-4S binding protein [Clostridia bacterium]|nr:4Fe-4S binding protein [Clostridia bacterium]